MKKIAVAVLLTFGFISASAQIDYAREYQNGKDLFRQGKYNLAMETFKPLIPYDQKNQYSPYASFYYALAAYKQGYKAVAKDMLLQIRSVHAKWDKMQEVNLWLAKIYMDDEDYFQGIKTLNAIQDKSLDETKKAIKAEYIAKIEDTETLKMMLEEFPKDEVVAKNLARSLSGNLSDEEDKAMLESLIERFKLERTDFIPEAPKTFFKDRYAVALLLPFMVDELDASPGKKRNQIVLDFYEGIMLALDSLNTSGPSIALRSYDTEKGLNYLTQLLQSNELKNTDLVIGPLYPDENKIVQDFSLNNQVNVVNPVSNNTDFVGDNPYAYLFQPSSETLGQKAAEYIAKNARKNLSIVISGTRDSVLAASFAKKANELGIQVVANRSFESKDAAGIMDLLATATEYDEFKFPSEFTLKKDSIGSIFVASNDPLIYTKVISAIETRGDSILVVGSENWIDDTAVAFEKYQSLGVTFTAPNFVSVTSPERNRFISKYLAKYGKVPSKLSQLGFEMMLFYGNQLKKNGVYFQDGLNKAEFIPGYLFQGYKFQYSRNNQYVPFVKFKNGILTLIESE
ncbi:MAG TPA: ABC transporter substrate-binding protein [Chryseosolibacter sp.]|nr:ABC transporter substrate-binding protein [Chryseosolibacter sp.]